jgi:hypothetical protein
LLRTKHGIERKHARAVALQLPLALRGEAASAVGNPSHPLGCRDSRACLWTGTRRFGRNAVPDSLSALWVPLADRARFAADRAEAGK